MDGLAPEPARQELRLLHAEVVQGRVRRLRRTGHDVGGATMADEQHLAFGPVGLAQCRLRNGLGAVESRHAVKVVRCEPFTIWPSTQNHGPLVGDEVGQAPPRYAARTAGSSRSLWASSVLTT